MSKLVVESIENSGGNNPLATLMTENTTTGGTEIDFTGIPSGVKKIKVMFEGLSVSGTSEIIIQIGDSGGIETSGYAGSSWAANTNNESLSDGLKISPSHVAASVYEGIAEFVLKDSANNTWSFTLNCSRSNTNAVSVGSGNKSLSGELDRLKITTQGGSDTFDANGGVNVRYEY